jgi:serine/threonine protein kinase
MIKNNELFLIDFGFSTFYIGDDKQHLPMKNTDKDEHTKEQLNIIGTPKYISLNIHNGITPSRRDDLISLGYIYIYLLKRELHWDNLPQLENNDNYQDIHILHPKNQYIKSMKQLECIEKILDNDNNKLYQSILYYIKYCYSLNYDDEPNYYSIKQLFMKMI